jgi:hypothetical protein
LQAISSQPPEAGEDVRLAEFAALRQEIAQRSSFQHGLMALNLTATGAIMGVVYGRSADRTLLLLLPILSPALGLLWFGTHIAILRIGAYIGRVLWIWTPSWELWLGNTEASEDRWWHRTWAPTVLLVFCGAPLAALSTVRPFGSGSLTQWLLWSSGLALTSFLVVTSVQIWRFPRCVDPKARVASPDQAPPP